MLIHYDCIHAYNIHDENQPLSIIINTKESTLHVQREREERGGGGKRDQSGHDYTSKNSGATNTLDNSKACIKSMTL